MDSSYIEDKADMPVCMPAGRTLTEHMPVKYDLGRVPCTAVGVGTGLK